MMRIIEGDLTDPRVVDLLHLHLTTARAQTAPGSAHALDITALQSPDISFWTIWALTRLLTYHLKRSPYANGFASGHTEPD